MAFKNIFDFARNISNLGTSAETEVSGYIPGCPNELISVPPHDPWKAIAGTQQDPKIVRETSPQAQIMFNLVDELTSVIKQSADKVELEISDPLSVVNPGELVMQSAQEITRKVTDDVPSPHKKEKT